MMLAVALALAYLLGSVPFSFLVARAFGVPDVREVGSGNVGATNVMRAAGKPAGVLAFVLDASKGAVAALIAQRLDAGPVLPPLAAGAAVLGHMFPVWLGFRGGKGVATGAGAFLPLAPLATALGLLAFVLTAMATRYVSLGSIVGTATLAATAFATGAHPAVAWSAVAIGALIVFRHRENLRRILRGTERRLGAPRP
ncbi:MAG TPA: glycerol-3-phosphate 1-O-acyltransferase PlsY [Vicinamibacteria bacterium]|nr:glycerol-3-phosphate 1-O-acyltransferase PlsY [Vicinamibacteria bacterium]